MIDFNDLVEAMGSLDEDVVNQLLELVISEGGADADKAMSACHEGMEIVGKHFESGAYFVGDLIYAGELMSHAVEILKPSIAGNNSENIGRMIICTVEGDLHDIGKNIVIAMLKASGFDVIDLGIDVTPSAIVDAVINNNIKIVALSGVLTLALDSMKKTVETLKEEELHVKVIIGGAPVNAEACKNIGADAWATNPQDGVKICKEWAVSQK